VFHNVFSFHDGKKFDLGLYPVGTVKQVTFDHPGLSRIFCNIHPNMAAYVMAVETPYFSVSDDEGRFTIASLPPGAYTYHAWRSGGTDLTGRPCSTPEQRSTSGGLTRLTIAIVMTSVLHASAAQPIISGDRAGADR
jgi:hypothetical protein